MENFFLDVVSMIASHITTNPNKASIKQHQAIMAPNYESDELDEDDDDEEEIEEEEVVAAPKKRSKKAWKVCAQRRSLVRIWTF